MEVTSATAPGRSSLRMMRGGVVPGEGAFHPVDGVDPYPAATQGGGVDLQCPPFPVPDPEDDGVGVGAADDGGGDPELHARLAGQSKGAGDAGIVGLHAQEPGHQGAVGAVPFAGGGKGAVEEQLRRRGPAPQQMAVMRPMRAAPPCGRTTAPP